MGSSIGNSSQGGRSVPRQLRLQLPADTALAQSRNRALWNDGRTAEEADFYTFGYSGRSTDEIFEAIEQAGVSTVLDVRFTPLSMYKPDFSKTNLRDILATRGLGYLHLPDLGVPRDIRAKAISSGDRAVIWEWYDQEIVPRFLGNLHRFFNIADHPVALMCVEIDPRACHRHRLFQGLEDLGLYGYDL
jgi:uncharacterized protein (DUF488 family)